MSSGAFIVQRCLSVKLTHNSDFPVMPVEKALWCSPALPGMQDLRCPGLSSNQTHSFNSQPRLLLVVKRKAPKQRPSGHALLGHSVLPVWEAGVSRSAFPLQSEEAGIRHCLLKCPLKKERKRQHTIILQAGGRRRAQLIHSMSWLSAAKGIPTETPANMEINLTELFLHLFLFVINGLFASGCGVRTFHCKHSRTWFAGKQGFAVERAAPSPCNDNGKRR